MKRIQKIRWERERRRREEAQREELRWGVRCEHRERK